MADYDVIKESVFDDIIVWEEGLSPSEAYTKKKQEVSKHTRFLRQQTSKAQEEMEKMKVAFRSFQIGNR